MRRLPLSWSSDAVFREEVPAMGDLLHDGPFHAFSRSAFLLKLPDGSRLHLAADGGVTIVAAPGADAARFGPLIDDSLFAAAAYFAGRLPFTAYAILIDGKVVLLGGDAHRDCGALALRFAGQGYPVSDAMVAIDPETLTVHTSGAPPVADLRRAGAFGVAGPPLFAGADHCRTTVTPLPAGEGYPCAGWIATAWQATGEGPYPRPGLYPTSEIAALRALAGSGFLRPMAEKVWPPGQLHRQRRRIVRGIAIHHLAFDGEAGLGAETFDRLHSEVLSLGGAGSAR